MTLSSRFLGATGFVLLTVVGSQLAANAQVAEPASPNLSALDQRLSAFKEPTKPAQLAHQPVSEPLDLEPAAAEATQSGEPQVAELPAEPAEAVSVTAEPLTPAEIEPQMAVTDSVDRTVTEANEVAQLPTPADETDEVAQFPGPIAGGNTSFVGIGGNIGLGDDGAPGGDPAFAVISKIAFTNRLAVRPSALIGDDVSFLIPVTYRFGQVLPDVGQFDLQPYAGAGVGFSVGDDSEIAGLISAGLDVPISNQFTANGQANLSIGDDTGFGVTLGVGYNFSNLFQ